MKANYNAKRLPTFSAKGVDFINDLGTRYLPPEYQPVFTDVRIFETVEKLNSPDVYQKLAPEEQSVLAQITEKVEVILKHREKNTRA